MQAFINVILVILKIVNIVFFAGTILFAILGIHEQIKGSANLEKLLKKLHIPLSHKLVLIIGIVCILLMFIIYILREKLSGRV